MKKIFKKIKNFLDEGYDYNQSNGTNYEWIEIGINLLNIKDYDQLDENDLPFIMMNNPGQNVTTLEDGWFIRAIWNPPENYDGESWSDAYYVWYKKRATLEEIREYENNLN